jgi:ATP-dependent RNA helicase DDX54/DBP10
MVLKRKRSPQVVDSDVSEAQSELSFEEVAFSEEDTDIFSSLMGSRPARRNAKVALGDDEEDEDEDEIIRQSMAKKRAKDGTDLLKKMKGKARITKGEVGGGSFQSMGAFATQYMPFLTLHVLQHFNHGYFAL